MSTSVARKYLGLYDRAATKQKCARLIAELAANNGMLPVPKDELTIKELAARFLVYARSYYVDAAGEPSKEYRNFNVPLTALSNLYGDSLVQGFGPRAFKTLREHFVAKGWRRPYVNKVAGMIRRVFRWAVAEELAEPSVFHGLQAVAGLKRGRCGAGETQPVHPVPNHVVDETIKVLTPTLAAMVELQRLTGMRSGELVIMRTFDLNTEGRIWTYRPGKHKTEHHGHQRLVYIGPAAQQVLR